MFAASRAWSQASERLFTTLARYERKGFTGCLEIRAGRERSWRGLFSAGRLGWIDGGVHPWRSWQRQLAMLGNAALQTQVAGLVNQPEVMARAQKSLWVIPASLLSTGKLAPQQFVSLLGRLCRESLFDIVWEIERCVRAGDRSGGLQVVVLNEERSLGNLPVSWLVRSQQLCARVQQDWQHWQETVPAGCVDCDINQALTIVEPELLAAQLAPATFQQISILFDGKRTLRDVAQAVKQDEIALIRMLGPFLEQGWLRLEAVPDTMPSIAREPKARPSQTPARKKTIACVDDSPQVLALIEIVARREGYDFVGIGDGLESIPILVQRRPDLIFLDLVLPVINGYELCQKLRQISLLRDTPIAMLSSNTLDPERAAKVGICECLEKPISPRQLTEIMARYTSCQPSIATNSGEARHRVSTPASR